VTRFCHHCGSPLQEPAPPHTSRIATHDLEDVRPRRRRSLAWIYYTFISVLSLVLAVSTHAPGLLLPAALAGAYAAYIYLGGSYVVWFW
jgi:hypothetical protein